MSNRRRSYTAAEREAILEKTGGHCHVCGGAVNDGWVVDHVVPHAVDANHDIANLLPAHGPCNRKRWFYDPRSMRLLLDLGIWASAEIKVGSGLGQKLEQMIRRKGEERNRRRKGAPDPVEEWIDFLRNAGEQQDSAGEADHEPAG